MCLIAAAWRAHPRFELALIANRDEFHGRPTAPAGSDPDVPDVYGGRDLEAGGSWLLASARGRLAAVTNVRAGHDPQARPRSRGALVRGFATTTASAHAYAEALAPTAAEYGRFNLLLWDGDALRFASNHPSFVTLEVTPGVHAMSNGAFDAPWPKSGHATRALAAWLESPVANGSIDAAALVPLFDALADATPAPDAALPDTGVGLELERALSPPFVRGERYGTRCSSVVLVSARTIVFAERRFGPGGARAGESFTALERARPVSPEQ
jgi:uncharacterized protein with NRDE domain